MWSDGRFSCAFEAGALTMYFVLLLGAPGWAGALTALAVGATFDLLFPPSTE